MPLGSSLKVLLDNVLDGVVVMSRDGNILGWNAIAEQSFGWSAEEAIGQSLGDMIVPPAYREMHRGGLERFNGDGEARVLNQRLKLSALTKAGNEIPVELTITLVQASNGEAFVGFLRDISAQDLAEKQARQLALESRLMFELSALAADSATLDEALEAALEAVCELTDWPLGHAYLVSDDGERLVSRSWSRTAAEIAPDFVASTEKLRFAKGVGLPGRILQCGKALWIERTSEETNFPRKGLGVEGAFGFPVLSHGKCIAVFEFFAWQSSPPDLHILQLVQSLGAQVGRVFERRLTDERRQVLMGELAHRTKNLISVIQGIAHQTFAGRADTDPKEALRLFNGRLAAIATAQTVLFDAHLDSLTLEDLITRSVEGCGVDTQRIGVAGPSIRLSPSVGLMLSLAIHELCTNAFKYGALSAPEGTVAVTWKIDPTTPRRFDLRWEECGGPQVRAPEKTGFGERILRRTIESETGGTAALYYLPTGFVYELTDAGHL
jgi:PAS domain S-box-containing protein